MFVLRFKTADRYYRQFNGKFVRNTFTEGPDTMDLEKAKIFYTVGSAKSSSYGSYSEIIPVSISIVGPPLP